LPRILWIQQTGLAADKESVEQQTGLKIAVSTGPPSAWRSIAHRIQMIVIELPLDGEIFKSTLIENQFGRSLAGFDL
jgi:hypothetical protein